MDQRAITPLDDPRVEALLDWAHHSDEPLTRRAKTALVALQDSPPRPSTAPGLALGVAAAYKRVPTRGPRDLQAGHAVVELLGELGEAGGKELVRLRERTSYKHALARIARTVAELQRRLGVPLGESEDTFVGPALDERLALTVPVGPFEAVLRVTDDLRRVQTTWHGASGQQLASRPAGVKAHSAALEAVDGERRRLRAHLTDLRGRLEEVMRTGRSWTVEEWMGLMFGDPLRAALTRRLVWRIERGTDVLALPGSEGLEDVRGRLVDLAADEFISLWHPAERPDAQQAWQRRLETLAIEQPIEQVTRDVIVADQRFPTLGVARGRRVRQTPFRGFLLRRGWNVPFLGPYFEVPEAKRELTQHGPIAVLDLEYDDEIPDVVSVGDLVFRSVQEVDLDARVLPPALVSEAARDVLGAVEAASSPPASTGQR